MEIFIFLAIMIALMLFVTNRGKKQQRAARERVEESLVPGTWVMTIGGFFGKVVEVDGDVVTLESPAGDETIWLKSAVKEPKEPPFSEPEETEDGADETDTTITDADATTIGDTTVSDTTGESTVTDTSDPTTRPGGPTVGEDGRLTGDDDKRA